MLTVKPNLLENRPAGQKREHDNENKNCCCAACEPIQELASGLLLETRARWWLGMYQAYLDDSGRGSGPSYVIAGFLASVEGWLAFSPLWKQVLDMPPALPFFKMKEAMNLRAGERRNSPFHGWPRYEIDRTVDLFTELITKTIPMRIRITVPNADWDRIYSGKIGPQTNIPFLLAHMSAIQETTRLLAATGTTDKVNFIFDTASQKEQHWVSLAWHFMKANEWMPQRNPLYGDPPDFRDDKVVLPLQAADLYAWHARKAKQMESEGKTYEHDGWKLISRIGGVERDWTAADLEKNFDMTRLIKDSNKWTWPYDLKPPHKRRRR